eukprot:2237854-Prymnesium_polylepis.1
MPRLSSITCALACTWTVDAVVIAQVCDACARSVEIRRETASARARRRRRRRRPAFCDSHTPLGPQVGAAPALRPCRPWAAGRRASTPRLQEGASEDEFILDDGEREEVNDFRAQLMRQFGGGAEAAAGEQQLAATVGADGAGMSVADALAVGQ